MSLAPPCRGPPSLASCDQRSLSAHALGEIRKVKELGPTRPGPHSDPWLLLMKRHYIMAVEVLKLARAEGVDDSGLADELLTGATGGPAADDIAFAAKTKSGRLVKPRARRRPTIDPPSFLDIGCGIGFYLYTLRSLGYGVRGLNAPDFSAPHLPRTWKALDLFPGTVGCAPVSALAPLPLSKGERFSVVTAFMMQFHTRPRVDGDDASGTKKGGLVRWGAPEWRYFLADLSAHHLRPRSLLVFEFVRGFGKTGAPSESADLGALFTALGARLVDRNGTKLRTWGESWLFSGDTWYGAQRELASGGGRGPYAPPDAAATAALAAKLGDAAARMAASLPIKSRRANADIQAACAA